MRTVLLRYILICFIIIAVCGCGSEKEEADSFDEAFSSSGDTSVDLSDMTLEEYSEGEHSSDNPYRHMQEIRLRSGDYTVETFILDSDNILSDDSSAASSKNGITMSVSLVETGDAAKMVNDVTKKELRKIKKTEGLKEDPKLEIRGSLGMVSYSIIRNGKEYPCVYICKADDIADSSSGQVILLTTIFVDNMKANEETADDIKEVMEITGLYSK